jgi:uncharacterized protein (DUF427 family)
MTDGTATAPEGAIVRPDNPQHRMVLKPIAARVRVHADGTKIADSGNAVWLLETFNRVYNPVIYIPYTDLAATLDMVEKTSHCPLKGDASYYAVNGDEIGWAYNDPFDFSAAIKGHHAFWPQKVRIEIGE